MTTTRILMTVNQAWSAEKSDKCEENSTKPPPSTLSSTVVSVAARELRETASTKEQALSHLRSWLAQNGDVRNVRLDESFLLRFLRQKKFSVPMAQQTLLKYLNLRKYYPEICKALDCQDPKLKELIEDGYIVISPVRDSHGRRVIVYDMGKFNASKFGCWEMARAHYLIYESLLEEQEDQVLGFTHVGDGGGASGSHVTCWNPIDFARLMKWGEQSIPMRHKEIHLVNVPATVKYVLDFACSKVSPKIVGRLYIHSNLRMLHKKVDVSCLPTIYGGNVPLEDMIAHTKQILMKHRPKVLGLDFMEIISTRGIQSARSKPGCKTNDTTSIQGSFRKLEID